jgi:hypothetical protein
MCSRQGEEVYRSGQVERRARGRLRLAPGMLFLADGRSRMHTTGGHDSNPASGRVRAYQRRGDVLGCRAAKTAQERAGSR